MEMETGPFLVATAGPSAFQTASNRGRFREDFHLAPTAGGITWPIWLQSVRRRVLPAPIKYHLLMSKPSEGNSFVGHENSTPACN